MYHHIDLPKIEKPLVSLLESIENTDVKRQESSVSDDSLQAFRSKYLTLTKTQPHNFEIVDKIYKNELTSTNEKLNVENRRKLRILNRTIQERIQKGTEIINTRMIEEDQNSEKERKQKATRRI